MPICTTIQFPDFCPLRSYSGPSFLVSSLACSLLASLRLGNNPQGPLRSPSCPQPQIRSCRVCRRTRDLPCNTQPAQATQPRLPRADRGQTAGVSSVCIKGRILQECSDCLEDKGGEQLRVDVVPWAVQPPGGVAGYGRGFLQRVWFGEGVG